MKTFGMFRSCVPFSHSTTCPEQERTKGCYFQELGDEVLNMVFFLFPFFFLVFAGRFGDPYCKNGSRPVRFMPENPHRQLRNITNDVALSPAELKRRNCACSVPFGTRVQNGSAINLKVSFFSRPLIVRTTRDRENNGPPRYRFSSPETPESAIFTG